MDILFQDRKLEKTCNDQSLLVRRYGAVRAKLLRRRLDEFRAAETLEVMRSLPQVRCHELKGNREGTLAVDWIIPIVSFLSQQVTQPQESLMVVWTGPK